MPEDVGQLLNARNDNEQPVECTEIRVVNDGQQSQYDDFVIPLCVKPMPENVEQWVKKST